MSFPISLLNSELLLFFLLLTILPVSIAYVTMLEVPVPLSLWYPQVSRASLFPIFHFGVCLAWHCGQCTVSWAYERAQFSVAGLWSICSSAAHSLFDKLPCQNETLQKAILTEGWARAVKFWVRKGRGREVGVWVTENCISKDADGLREQQGCWTASRLGGAQCVYSFGSAGSF